MIFGERLQWPEFNSDNEPDDIVLLLHSLNLTSTTNYSPRAYLWHCSWRVSGQVLRDSPTNSTQQLFLRRPQTNDYVLIFALCHCHPLLLLTSASWTVYVYIYIKPTVATDSKPHSPLRPESFCQRGFNTFCRLRILRIRNEGIWSVLAKSLLQSRNVLNDDDEAWWPLGDATMVQWMAEEKMTKTCGFFDWKWNFLYIHEIG